MSGLTDRRIDLRFDDNRLLPLLYGEHDRNLARIETQLGVSLISRGNVLTIAGPAEATDAARSALDALYARLRQGLEVGVGEVDAAVRMATTPEGEAARESFARARFPVLALSITDDELMTLRGTQSLMSFYENAPRKIERIAPSELAVRRIGHFGPFRTEQETKLWPRMAEGLRTLPGAAV